MKTTLFSKYMLSIATALICSITPLVADEGPSAPAVALPPAQVILKAAADMGVEAVDLAYVKSKLPALISGDKKVFVIDARPEKNYGEGHISTAFNMYDAKFELDYPKFEALNIPKDAEIFLGIGRPCPMSLNDAKLLKEKGYTNLKAFVKGPVWIETQYVEVNEKMAKSYIKKGATFVDLATDSTLAKFVASGADKEKKVVLVGAKENAKVNYAAAEKVHGMGYKWTFVFNGTI